MISSRVHGIHRFYEYLALLLLANKLEMILLYLYERFCYITPLKNIFVLKDY